MKELFHFVPGYDQLPKELYYVKWIVRVNNLGVVSLILNAVEWTSMFCLTQDP